MQEDKQLQLKWALLIVNGFQQQNGFTQLETFHK